MALSTFSACSDADRTPAPAAVVIGKLEDPAVGEASGLARSYRRSNLLWVINDSGAGERLHAISARGKRLGEFAVENSVNRDWEDLASFVSSGVPYLMIADIGDNEARHKSRTLYFVAEPEAAIRATVSVAWRVDYKYPGGPRDAEAAAVDTEKERALILTKRDVPPVLYEVPLKPAAAARLVARKLGAITSLPRPSRRDIEFAPNTNDCFWQPVGMDISDDNLAAVILTCRAAFYYERRPGQAWIDALNTPPRRVSIGNIRNAEAVAFAGNKRTVIITGEGRHSPVLAIDFSEDATR